MKASLFSEERRAARGSRGGMLLVTILLLILSGAVWYLTYTYHTKPNLPDLQRVYYDEYSQSAWYSLLPFDTKAQYLLLVRFAVDPKTKKEMGLICRAEEVVPILDEDGKVQRTADNYPDIRLKKYYFDQSKGFKWDRPTLSNKYAYTLLRQNIYEGQAIYQLYLKAMPSALLIFFPGMIGAVVIRRRLTRKHLKGETVRGTRELSPKEYERLHRRDTGIGLEVFTHEGGN
jgi:hypothetical protein